MSKSILVVDDAPNNVYLLRVVLEDRGFVVHEARNGVEALEQARRQPPDAVVTDLLMPGMDGFALARAWMRDETLRTVPFIVYTATYTEAQDRRLALDLGAAAFIVKPTEPAEFVQVVESVLANGKRARVPSLHDDNFYGRYSERLREKLERKVAQLADAERALTDYVSRCETILDASADAIVSFDPDLRIRTWNFAAETLLGYAEAEAVGRSLSTLTEHRTEFEAALAAAGRDGRSPSFETAVRCKDGNLREVRCSIARLGLDVGFVCLVSDLSPIRQMAIERQKLAEQLASSQRLESVGRLAGGVAHDFNNLLTIILSHAAFIESDLDDANPLRGDARHIREAAERAAALTRQLLAFSRRQPMKPVVLDVNETVRSMEPMLRRLIGEDVELEVLLERELGHVQSDPSQLEQVILNLAINGRDAMPDGGRLTIETANATDGPFTADDPAPGGSAPFVRLSVMDTGMGMDAETQAHAFEPFFTTKEQGRGTGLGLSTVYGIVRQSGGFVSITSEPGRGARFDVYLPRVDRPLTPRPVAPVELSGPGGGETILVVEDDDMLRALNRRILEQAGYRVLEASHGGEALRIAEEHRDLVIDLLLTDVIMPRMNGGELAKRIRSARPHVKVLFTSGYTDDAIARQGLVAAEVTLLEKPFSGRQLVDAIHRVLRSST